jgi:D-beta-D-heptose 7-phosphate kinase/D-beta-D-heptose 1-phosphate adenosyltransferase
MSVWINGTFDILHPGHLELFRAADDFDGNVIVGIDSDRRVRERKGRDPIFTESQRAEMLSAIWNVAWVMVFDNDEELVDCIKRSKADTIIVGKEYEGKVIGGDLVKEIVYVSRIRKISTSQIIEKCKNL